MGSCTHEGTFMTHYLLGLRRDGDGEGGSTLELAQRGGSCTRRDAGGFGDKTVALSFDVRFVK